MIRSVLVYGPQRCGKTTNAEAMRKAYGLDVIVDDWTWRDPLPDFGALILTSDESVFHTIQRIRVVTFEAAMVECGLAVMA
jgi:replication-associated recombination protein RarA